MRQMLKEFEEKPKEKDEVDSEDRLEQSLMSGKERRAKKKKIMKERLAEMSGKDKVKYIIYYYKWHFIITIASILVLGSLAFAIYKNTRPVSISAVVINPESPLDISEKPFKEFAKSKNLVKGYRLIADTFYNLNLEYSLSNDSATTNNNSFAMLVQDNYYDVMITDRAGLEYSNYLCILFFMDDIFDQEFLDRYKDRIYYSSDFGDPENARKAVNARSTDVLAAIGDRSKPLAIDISDTEFAKKLNLGYEDVYLCFPGNSKRNLKKATQLLEYIFR